MLEKTCDILKREEKQNDTGLIRELKSGKAERKCGTCLIYSLTNRITKNLTLLVATGNPRHNRNVVGDKDMTERNKFDNIYSKRKSDGSSGWQDDWRYRGRKRYFQRLLTKWYCPKEGNLLELGCGNGVIGLWFAERGFNVHGFDISRDAIDWANENARQLGVSADFREGNLLRPADNYPSMLFDFIFDGDSTQYISDADWPLFYKSIRAMLKPGGLFWLSVGLPNESFHGEYRDRHWHYKAGDRTAFYDNNQGYRICAPKEYIIQEVTDAGFKIQELEEFTICDWEGYPADKRNTDPPFFSKKSIAISLS